MNIWKRCILITVILSCMAAIYIIALPVFKKGIEVNTARVNRGDISSGISSSGTIQSRTIRDYFVYSASKIEKVYVSVGDVVEKDELLVKLEVPDLSDQLKQAYMQLDIAQVTLDNLTATKQNGRNSSTIPVTAMGINIGNPADDIDGMIKLQQKQVYAARLNLESVKDAIKNVQWGIKSGIRGIVTAVNAEDGGVASIGIPVVTVEDTDNICAVVIVSQYDALKVKEGQKAVIRLGGGAYEYDGFVERINPIVKKNTQLIGAAADNGVTVDIKLSDPGDIILGYDVDVDITTDLKGDVLYVPYECVVRDKDNNVMVYVVEDGRVYIRNIKAGTESDFYVEVLDGLKEGDSVVLNPSSQLEDGSYVKINNDGRER